VVKQATEKEIANLNIARQMKKIVDKLGLTKDIRAGGLSLEDIAGRLQTLIGVYILQGYYAAKEHKHPYETNGRNAVVWLMTIALPALPKSENFGVNTLLLNPIMQKKGTASKIPGMQNLLDKVRMDADYFDIIEKAGIKVSDAEKIGAQKGKKALWASGWLDSNRIEQIQNLAKELQAKVDKKEVLKEGEADILKSIPGFFKRVNTFNIASTAIITAATVYFIGGVAMKIVNKVFTPLDNNPAGGKDKNAKNDKNDKTQPQGSNQPAAAAQPAPMPAMTKPQPPSLPTMQMLSQPSFPPIMPLPFLPALGAMPPKFNPALPPFITSPNLLNRPAFPGPFANQQPGGLN